MQRQPAPYDLRLLRRRSDAAAAGYEAAAVLAREVARRMGERLDFVKLDPAAVLDIGCGTGADLAWLGRRYPRARRLGCDASLGMLARAAAVDGGLFRWRSARRQPVRLCADANRLPLASGAVDLAWSNLAMQWLADPRPALAEAHRVLRLGGLLMFSTLGPDTLAELRGAFREADDGPHVLPFPDMHDIGDLLLGVGFAEPVMDTERITLTYADAAALIADLRRNASGNPLPDRQRGLTGRGGWQRMLAALDARRQGGRLAASFEVVYGHAWKAVPRTRPEGPAVVRFERRGAA